MIIIITGVLFQPDLAITRLLEAWIDRAATLGREVRVDTPGGSVTGRAVDVTDVGALVLETAAGTRTVTAGDCEHLRPV